MKNKKALKIMIAMMMVFMFAAVMTACGGQEDTGDAEETTAAEETEAVAVEVIEVDPATIKMKPLMKQVAEDQVDKTYEEYVPDEAFANAKVFAVEKDGEHYTAYVYLNTGEYVAVKGNAYFMSGSAGEAILKFDETPDGLKLTEVSWSADGDDHDAWIKENFSETALAAWNQYNAFDKDGNNKLQKKLEKKVEKKMGVPVETENLLEIDTEAGTYEIVKTIESGSPENDDYKFDTEIVESGSLSELSE